MTIETVYIAGVPKRPLYKKVNPLWWLGNDEEPTPPAWHKPNSPYWWRWVSWYLRNPFRNCGNYVIGIADTPHTSTGPAPVSANVWSDVNPKFSGWKWVISHTRLFFYYPYVSFENAYIIFYAGWQADGFFGFKFNLKFGIQLW